MSIKPTADRIVVEPAIAEEKTSFGIYLPESVREKPQRGKVLAISDGKYADQTGVHIPSAYKVGDEVLYAKHAGTEIVHEGKEYLILRESEIYATL